MHVKEINQRFVEALNHLRIKNYTYKEVYESVGLTRGRWNSIKQHLTIVPDDVVDALKSKYPEVQSFFLDDYKPGLPTNQVSEYREKYMKSLEYQVELQKEKIQKLESENIKLRGRLQEKQKQKY